MRKFRVLVVCLILAAFGSTGLFAQESAVKNADGLRSSDSYTLVGDRNFVTDYAAMNEDGSINVVIEIPAGTIEKWEVEKSDGSLKWTFESGQPRTVNYLPYPGHYGMIPATLLSKENGGDGDPLDAIVLGPAVPRGSVVKAKILGVLKLFDNGEKDDKVLAVMEESPMYEANTLIELVEGYPGVINIIELWFSNYKGQGQLESKGFSDVQMAQNVVKSAIRTYNSQNNRN